MVRNRTIALSPNRVEKLFDELPSTGDKLEINGERYFIEKINIVNDSKMELMVVPDRSIKRYSDWTDPSVDWPKLPDKFLDSGKDGDVDFTDEESLFKR